MKIKTALVSVADKSGLQELARALQKWQTAVYSTGGTAAALRELGVAVADIAELTGMEEMLDGRVKTLHPRIHAAILADSGNEKHAAELKKMRLPPLDLVAVNFYPFEKHVGGDEKTLIEYIDIGGPDSGAGGGEKFRPHRGADRPAGLSGLCRRNGKVAGRNQSAASADAGGQGVCGGGAFWIPPSPTTLRATAGFFRRTIFCICIGR